MKIWRWGLIGLVILANACSPNQVAESADTDSIVASLPDTSSIKSQSTDQASCEPMEPQIPLQQAADGDLPFERFDFRPIQVSATDTTLSFKGRRYSFTFCKGDRTWGVEAFDPASETEADYSTYLETLADPEYETVTSNDTTYRARVRLDASWLNNQPDTGKDREQVIFELIKPGNSETTSKVLYTNTQIIEQELGASVGVPELTRSLATDDALWWSIGFEQGEGASGIATIVQYKIDTDELILWQPTELSNMQITDMALTGTAQDLTLWLGTQYSGEGNPYLPAKGLVAYRPNTDTIKSYTVDNSPLIGAIPTRLWTEAETLWIATASGACEVEWATIEGSNSWTCWRFTTMADVPAGQELYSSLLAETSIDTLESSGPLELLWVTDTDISTPEATLRYEVKYDIGITAQLNQGADYYIGPDDQDEGYFWWPGGEWSWNGERFVRYWDQVATNYVGGGPQGIGPDDYENYIIDWKTMRGEFELVDLTPESTEIKYFSAWIDGVDIEPWVTVTEVANPSLDKANPTDTVLTELKQATR